jgi:hypothetical protein
MKCNEYLSTISVYKKGIEMSPTEPWPIWHLGQTYSRTGDHDEAIWVFEIGNTKYPGD